MSTAAEIEKAIERLPSAERESLENRLLSRRFGMDALNDADRAELLGSLDEAESASDDQSGTLSSRARQGPQRLRPEVVLTPGGLVLASEAPACWQATNLRHSLDKLTASLIGAGFFAFSRGNGNIWMKSWFGEVKAGGENTPPRKAGAGGVKIKDADAWRNLTAG